MLHRPEWRMLVDLPTVTPIITAIFESSDYLPGAASGDFSGATEWMQLSTVCPAPAGSVQIRDVRAWHGGTPNLSDDLRAIPNLEFCAPWFREPMIPGISHADHRTLTEHAPRLTRYSVVDSSEELPSGYVVKALPKRPSSS